MMKREQAKVKRGGKCWKIMEGRGNREAEMRGGGDRRES